MKLPLLSIPAMTWTIFFALFSVHADEGETERNAELTARRNQLMEQRMTGVKVSSTESGFPTEFAAKPIFRYTDPARSYVAAAVWKLGDKGRPKAVITTELHRQFDGSPRLVYEYLSLTSTEFMVTGKDIHWNPKASVLSFKPVPATAAPEDNPRRRLLQMKSIVDRFSGTEIVGNEQCELRLMPQPIDRYVPGDGEREDGAVFVASYGTNPEVLLFIESDGKTWNYAAGRLSSAATISLSIDDAIAWEGDPVKYGVTSPYNASNAKADIPGVAADGSEIKD